MKKLLVEHVTINPGAVSAAGGRYLVESSGGRMTVTLPVTTLDVKNLNERTYSSTVMEGAIGRAKNAFEGRELLSSVNEHPTETAYVTPGAASHVVVGAWNEGGLMYNRWEILDTAAGRDLRALVEANVAFGVSIRGLGSTDNYGNILDDYEFLGCDCVADPSAQLRVKAEVVAENRARATAIFNQPAIRTEGSKTMKTRESLEKFLNEQRVLLTADLGQSRIAAYQRLTQVETAIAEAQLPAADLARVYQRWETIKGEFTTQLESAPATTASVTTAAPVAEAQELALVRKLLESRTQQLRTMMGSVKVMSGRLRESAAKKTVATRMVEGRTDSTQRAAARRDAHQLKLLQAENVRLKAALETSELRAAKFAYGMQVAIAEAAKNDYATRVAVSEAARLTVANGIVKPAAPVVAVVEGRRAVGRKPAAEDAKKPTTFEKRKAVQSGEHGIRGWI
jgi:hypothetical protein